MSRLSISIAVCAAMTVSLSANAATQKDSGDDSVNSWGPWEGVKTAAGPRVSQIPFRIGFVQSQNSRNAAAFEADVEEEEQSGWKGYVTFTNRDKGTITLNLSPEQNRVSARVDSASRESILFDQNGRFYKPGENVSGWGVADNGYKYRQFEVDSDSLGLKTSTVTHWNYGKIVDSDDVTFGVLDMSSQHVFVAGSLSPISEIQALVSGNVSATYSGYGFYYGHGYSLNTVNVDFGKKSWSGSWDGLQVQAAGTLNSQGFESTSVSGSGVSAGSVEGTFYGANAHSLGGQLDVTKNGNRIVGVFINEQVQPK